MEELQVPRKGWRRHQRLLIGGLAAVLLLGGGTTGVVMASKPAPPVVPHAAISIPGDSAAVAPAAVIGVQLKHARLIKVSVLTSGGKTLAGHLTPVGWQSDQPMPWATKIVMTVTARGGSPRKTVVQTAAWTTAIQPLPTESIGLTISPGNGEQVGMGAAWVIQFSQPIPAADQQAVLRHLTTQESIADPVGWHWWSSTEVDGRPEQFWPIGEQASLTVNLDGLVINGYRLEGTTANRQFLVINQHLTKVSAVTHQEQIYNGTQLINTFPVSLGRAGFPTISGTLVVLFKTPVVFMNSATIGYPGLYAQNVYEDVAISTDGYYIHSANWDIYDHGVANVSHGCVEQNPNDATWFYNWSVPGDVVEISGTTLQASEADGEGDWNIPWTAFQTA
ncbi:MAG TPA: Ig-like domain-containing protein [Candidatus Dormibacteraeota bacterium]|nr:Ig-like domain-containing protein [Candidatus Dormibacteraeota bacterium]